MKHIAACLIFLAPQAHAQALSLEEFHNIVSGSTLSYANQGEAPFGIEYYSKDGTIIWSVEDTECTLGTLVQGQGDEICLDYVSFDFCLAIFASANGLRGRDAQGNKYDIAFTNDTASCFPNE